MVPLIKIAAPKGPSVAEKIKLLRQSRRMTQVDLAALVGCKPERIIKIEKGEAEYLPDMLEIIKKEFDIEGMPLTEQEREVFKRHIHVARSLVKPDSVEQVKEKLNSMAKVVNLEPCDYNLVTLYRMVDLLAILAEGNRAAFEEKFNSYPMHPDKMDSENLYYYNYIKGFMLFMCNSYIESLAHCHTALQTAENDSSIDSNRIAKLCYTVAACYSNLEYPYRAIKYVCKAKELYVEDVSEDFCLYIANLLARNYIRVNELGEAKQVLDEALVKIASANSDMIAGLIMRCYGLMLQKSKDWNVSIDYFDKALGYFKEDTDYYKSAICFKIHSLIGGRKFSSAKKLIAQAREAYDDEVWTIYFEALEHFYIISRRISTRNYESCEYLETIAIPFFIQRYDYFFALDYYKLLECHYQKTNRHSQTAMITRQILDLTNRCLLCPEGGI